VYACRIEVVWCPVYLLFAYRRIHDKKTQVKFCYGANGKAATPCRLSVTSCRGIVADELDKIQGSQQWFINKEERCWLQVFERRKTDLVYLTADSPNLLTAVDPAGVYIVGGIVDRNQWKGATLMKAMNLSISHAKLPIGEHLKLTTSEVQTSVAIPLPFFPFLHKILSMV
jgi:tRNA (guanine9-N1)-methyltransferase